MRKSLNRTKLRPVERIFVQGRLEDGRHVVLSVSSGPRRATKHNFPAEWKICDDVVYSIIKTVRWKLRTGRQLLLPSPHPTRQIRRLGRPLRLWRPLDPDCRHGDLRRPGRTLFLWYLIPRAHGCSSLMAMPDSSTVEGRIPARTGIATIWAAKGDSTPTLLSRWSMLLAGDCERLAPLRRQQ